MKEGWEVKDLGYLCELTRGYNPPKSKFSNHPKEGFVRFYQIRDGWSDEYAVYVPDTPQLHKVSSDEILMVAYRHIGRAFRGVTGAFNVALCKISNKKKLLLNDDFLFYMIPTDIIKGELMKRSERSLIPSMSVDHLRKIRIPTPPLSEQQRIVAVLDQAFTAIDKAKANLQQNIENARQLFQSELNRIFTQKGDGWVEKKLGEVLDFLNGFAFKSFDAVSESNTQLIRMGNLYQNILDIERSPVFYPNNFSEMYDKYLLKEGDLIISLTGTTGKEDYGFTVKIPKTNRNLLLNQRIAKIIIKDNNLIKEFLHYFLLSRVFLDAVYSTANGTRQANLSTVVMKELLFHFPSKKDIQEDIIKRIYKIRENSHKLQETYQQKLTALEELKKSILQKAFSGELSASGFSGSN